MRVKNNRNWTRWLGYIVIILFLSGCSLVSNPTPLPVPVIEPQTLTPASAAVVTLVPPSSAPPSPTATAGGAPDTPEVAPLPPAPANSPGSPPSPIPVPPTSGSIYYVDPQKGKDGNPGTGAAPWQTIQKATTSIRGGDTVILNTGIYRIEPNAQFHIAILRFGPEGRANALTTFRAAPGARALITTTAGNPVNVQIENYVRLDGLWFGGAQDVGPYKNQYGPLDHAISLGTTGHESISEGKQILNCTIFGYRSGIISGSAENALIQGNRLILNGADGLYHGIYLSGGDRRGDGQSNHIVVDNNILIGGEGYGLHSWHTMRNAIYTRNFVTSHNWGSVLDGTDHLEANNFFWKENGSPGLPAWGPWVPGSNIDFINNILGPNGWLRVDSPQAAANRFDTNAFYPWMQIPGTPNGPEQAPTLFGPRGSHQIILTPGQESSVIGISAQDLDSAIAALKKSFSQPVEAIMADQSIEANLTQLRFKIPQGSPLYQTGLAWFGQKINVGPDSPAPGDWNAFWAAFRGIGLRDWNQAGNEEQ